MDLTLIVLIISVTIMYMTSQICETIKEIIKAEEEKER